MSVAIREGYSVKENEVLKVQALQKLANLGIFKLKLEKVQYCKCNAMHIVDGVLLNEGKVTCSCGKTVHLSKTTSQVYFIGKLDYDRITELFIDKLSFIVGNFDYDSKQRCWIGTYKGKKIPIFILEISSFNQYLDEQSDSCWICIVLDWEKEIGRTNYYNALHFVSAESILDEKVEFSKTLDCVTDQFSSNPTVELGEKFDKYVRSIDWRVFEQFTVDFLNEAKANCDSLKRYINFLTARKNTIDLRRNFYFYW